MLRESSTSLCVDNPAFFTSLAKAAAKLSMALAKAIHGSPYAVLKAELQL